MSEGETGKKVGLAGAGLAGVLGLLGKMEHGLVASKAALAPAAHLAGDGAKIGARALPAAAEGLGVGAAALRPTALFGKGSTRALAGTSHAFEGLGLRAAPFPLIEDGARLGAARPGFSLVEHSGAEVAGWTFDAASLLVDDPSSPNDGKPAPLSLALTGRSMLIALEPGATDVGDEAGPNAGPNAGRAAGRLLIRPSQIHGTSGLLDAVRMFRGSSPVVVVGRRFGDGLRVPEAPNAIDPSALAAACAGTSALCTVVVCGVDAPPTCEQGAAHAWTIAAAGLSTPRTARDIGKQVAHFDQRLLDALHQDPATADVETTLVDLDAADAPRLVHATKAAAAAPAASSATTRTASPAVSGGTSRRSGARTSSPK
jgi:hypothetical protein